MAEAVEFGLSDADLATHPTIYGSGAYAGCTVLISGGAGGIGRATAWLLGRLGAHVILTGRSAEKLGLAREAMQAKGLTVSAYTVDIREPDSVEALFGKLADDGGIDILVNSAGGQFPQAAIDFSTKGWNTVVNTNLNGTWSMMQQA